MAKARADVLLVERGLAESRARAKVAILAGQVRVGADHVVRSAAEMLPEEAELSVTRPCPYVSRGAYKLEPALDRFLPRLDALVALDVGASTGGFTDLMVQRGAARVYAVDVGHGQLHLRLREDARVVCLEKVNARSLSRAQVPEPVDVVTVDVSFISLRKVLAPAAALLKPSGWVFALVKPQFEAGRRDVEKGGVVRCPAVRERVAAEVCAFAETELGWRYQGGIPSPIKGPKGNQELVAVFRGRAPDAER